MNSATTTKGYRTIDLVTITTLGVAFGAIYWGWDYSGYEAWSKASYAIYPPSAGLFWGVWLIAGVVGGLVVGKPGAAVATELIAASVEALIPGGNPWGFATLISGGLQGLGAELILAVFLYRRFNPIVAGLAGALAASFETFWEWHAYYPKWHLQDKLAYLGFFALSGVVIAGLGGWLLVRALARTGVLDAFPAGREAAGEI